MNQSRGRLTRLDRMHLTSSVQKGASAVSARNRGVHAIDVTHTALNGNPWLPTGNGMTSQLNP